MATSVDRLTLDALTADPGAADGDLWFNTTDGKFRLRRDGATKDIADRKVNASATTAPGVNDDSSAGYEQESLWFDTTNNKVYMCIDASVGAAVWPEIGAAAPGNPVGAASLFSSVIFNTTSTTFVDAFGGSSISPTVAGNWLVFFEGSIEGSSNNTSAEVAIGKNLTTVAQSGSEREIDTGNNNGTFLTSALLMNLLVSDTVHGIARRSAGSGTVTMNNRRLTMFRVDL